MRARRVGKGSEFRLIQNEREIGHVNGSAIRFYGFATRDDAAVAASLAHRALARRRKGAARRAGDPTDVLVVDHEATELVVARWGILARLVPPSSENPQSGWGFEVRLLPDEAFEVFAVGRARVMWRALRSHGLPQRMLQFRRGVEQPAGPG